MNITESKAANALGGKTARACASCLIKRARWFCTADDAFLCQACDASVHSANQLASRHERVRLETSSFKGHDVINNPSPTPASRQGFTRMARTLSHDKSAHLRPPTDCHQPLAQVPEINGEDPFAEEIDEEEELLYRVPVFDPFGDEFCSTHEMIKGEEREKVDDDVDLNLEELLLSTCDVESLLGNGDREGSSAGRIDEIDLGLVESVDCGDEGQNLNDHEVSLGGKRVKVEEEDYDEDDVQAVIECHFDPALDMELNWDFDYATSMSNGEVDGMKKEVVGVELGTVNNVDMKMIRSGEESQVDNNNHKKKRMMMLQLRLNYEAVIAAWETQGSPWTNGIRPHEFNFDEFMDACSGGSSHPNGGFGGRLGSNDAGREARVSRYREKRRTRLFSKKIRYQVRKLNAEKRPRMKGRFVKRTNFSGPSLPYMMNK